MPNNNGIITAPVSFDDVRKVLGHGSRDLGTLCTETNVSKWSKHKPTSYPSLFPQNGVQWKGNGKNTIWGMKVDSLQSVNSAKDVYEDGTFTHHNWEWDKPVGGENSPYRITDFDGYNHNASGIYIQPLPANETENIYVSSTATESPVFSFTVYGSKTNGVCFSDIEDVVKVGSNEKLRLVISVYKKGTNELLAEYFNNGIKLSSSTNATLDDSFDSDNSYKMASVKFSKSDYWGKGISEIDVYLTFQTIYYEASMYNSKRTIALPYTIENYYKKSFKFFTAYRYIRAIKLHNGATAQGTRNWIDISPLNPIRLYDTSGTPDLQFEVSKMPDETLTFQNGICWLRSRYYRKSDGKTIVVNGTLTSETGSNIPTSVTVPTGNSGTINVFFHFGNMFQEGSHTEGYYPSGQYTAEIYLVKENGVQETETKVTNVTIYTS